MMKKYIAMIVVSLMAVSCIDTIILPDDVTVEEDFWKKKADVQSMVSGAYRSMNVDLLNISSNNNKIMPCLLVWNGLRSDEMVPVTTLTSSLADDLQEINLANIQEDNEFVTWDYFYRVINNCNLVLEKAGKVVGEDPSYTQSDYLADCSKMLALRALCYFYLVRHFRDIPFVVEAFTNSAQNRNIAQSAPALVLEQLISDLETAERNAVTSNAYGDWQDKGFFTRDAIQALMADIYLWRGSVMRNADDCAKCVEYCDKVIASKKLNHVASSFRGENENDSYPSLLWGSERFAELYVYQNAEESIFELQYTGRDNNTNKALCQYYNHSTGSSAPPYLYAAPAYASTSVYPVNDWRGALNIYHFRQETEYKPIRKYVDNDFDLYQTVEAAKNDAKSRTYDLTYYQQNFIVYRLADVMLMKAEALVAAARMADAEETGTDTHLQEAFNLIREVNARSLENPGNDSLKWTDYSSKTAAQMEEEVLKERQRELAFEGKRWYDLLRYTYRNDVADNAVDYNLTLNEQYESGSDFAIVETNCTMLSSIQTKLGSTAAAAIARLRREPSWYLPVPMADLKVSPLLKQNPNYSSNSNTSKN